MAPGMPFQDRVYRPIAKFKRIAQDDALLISKIYLVQLDGGEYAVGRVSEIGTSLKFSPSHSSHGLTIQNVNRAQVVAELV